MAATIGTVKEKITKLIRKANDTTGKSDTDLTSGVNSLIAGYGNSSGTIDSPKPIEISSESDMLDIIINATADDVGAVYKYTGTTGIYENGALYIIEVSD